VKGKAYSAKGTINKACLYVRYLGFYVGECPHVPKILMMDQSNGSLWERKKTTTTRYY
jgi:hypothetical protein